MKNLNFKDNGEGVKALCTLHEDIFFVFDEKLEMMDQTVASSFVRQTEDGFVFGEAILDLVWVKNTYNHYDHDGAVNLGAWFIGHHELANYVLQEDGFVEAEYREVFCISDCGDDWERHGIVTVGKTHFHIQQDWVDGKWVEVRNDDISHAKAWWWLKWGAENKCEAQGDWDWTPNQFVPTPPSVLRPVAKFSEGLTLLHRVGGLLEVVSFTGKRGFVKGMEAPVEVKSALLENVDTLLSDSGVEAIEKGWALSAYQIKGWVVWDNDTPKIFGNSRVSLDVLGGVK